MKNTIHCALAALVFITLICVVRSAAQTDAAFLQSNAAPPIGGALNADGSINPAIAGGFSAQGFEMRLNADGSPRFTPKTAAEKDGDENPSPVVAQGSCGDGWDDRFAAGGANGSSVNAVVSDGAGNIYIGGDFTSVGGVAANRIAKWDGTSWSPLGAGLGNIVYGLAPSGTDLYAGGAFSTAGGILAFRIAKWDGTSWSALGSGFDSVVFGVAVSGANVYAVGQFTTAGGVGANRIARWNGSSWSPLGTGLNSVVLAMAVSGTDVYVGGNFTTAGGAAASRIARWNGSSWSGLGAGMDSSVLALAVSGTNVYAGGAFSNYIAKWDGTSWSPLGAGMNNRVTALTISGTDVYAGGAFTTAGGAAASRIAKWDGTNWSALDAGMNNNVAALAISGTDLYAGGSFTTAGCRNSSRFARYFNQRFIGGGNFADFGANDEWFNAANWSNGNVPAADSDATIAAADVSIGAADATVRDLRVDEGRTVTVQAGRTLTVTRSLNLLGSITGAGTVIVSNCDSSALARDAAAGGYIRTTLVRCVNSAGTYDFPVGTANGYSPIQMTNITGTGNVSIRANEGAYSNPAAGLPTNRLARWWQIENQGGGIAQTDLTFNYLPTDITGTESQYKAYRIAGGTAAQVTSTVNAAADTVTATNVTQFSDWTLAQSAITAASVSVSGRVLTLDGRGLGNATIRLTDDSGSARSVRTNSFGNYRFNDVAVGATYTLSVPSRRYSFAPQTVSVSQEVTDLNFTANSDPYVNLLR